MTISLNRKENFLRPWYHSAQKLLSVNLTGKSILDLGGGAAEFSRILRDKGAMVTFADGAEDAVEKAKSLGFSSFRVDLNEPLNIFKNNQFDMVVMLEVIEHVVRTDILLSEVNRVLNNGGYLLITTPNISHIASLLS